MMRTSIIVSAFVFCFVIVATAVLGWNHQLTSERQDTDTPSLNQADLVVECPAASLPAPAATTLDTNMRAAESDQPIKKLPTEQMLKEIESIRRQLGIQLFPNDRLVAEEESSNQDFRNALNSVVSNDRGIRKPSVPQPLFAADQSLPESLPNSPHDKTCSLNAKLIDELQGAILALEQRAALLEEMRRYDDADRSRRLAHKLRKEIRTLQDEASQ